MSYYPKMTASWTRDDDELILDIEHADAQSFSRSVDPKAMREARAILRDGRQWALTNVDYAIDHPSTPRRCISRYYFHPAT